MRYGSKTKTLRTFPERLVSTGMDLTKVWSIYAMAVFLEEKTYFKIGRTNRIETRIASVQCGCPVPIDSVLRVDGLTAGDSADVEISLHKALADWNSSGEWFCFDLDSDAQKKAWNDACDRIFARVVGQGWKWVYASVEETRRHGAEFSKKRRHEWEAQRRRRERDPEERLRRMGRGLAPEFWE